MLLFCFLQLSPLNCTETKNHQSPSQEKKELKIFLLREKKRWKNLRVAAENPTLVFLLFSYMKLPWCPLTDQLIVEQ